MAEVKYDIFHYDDQRYLLFPIRHKQLWDFYKRAEKLKWSIGKILLYHDKQTWKTLTEDKQHLLKYVFAFSIVIDGITNEHVIQYVLPFVQVPEARLFYTLQVQTNYIHSEWYATLVQTFIEYAEEQKYLFQAVRHIPAVNKKLTWAIDYLHNNQLSFGQRLVAFVCIQQLFSIGCLCVVQHGNAHIPGIASGYALVQKDIRLQCEFASYLFQHYCPDKPSAQITALRITEAVTLEQLFVRDCLPVHLDGLRLSDVMQYIAYCGDLVLSSFQLSTLYNVENPFEKEQEKENKFVFTINEEF